VTISKTSFYLGWVSYKSSQENQRGGNGLLRGNDQHKREENKEKRGEEKDKRGRGLRRGAEGIGLGALPSIRNRGIMK